MDLDNEELMVTKNEKFIKKGLTHFGGFCIM